MPEAKDRLSEFLARDWRCSSDMPHKSRVPRNEAEAMRIQFKPGFENFIPRPKTYKTPINYQPIMRKILEELLKYGVITPSKSPYCSPCLIIPKPHQEGVAFCDLKWRLVVDLRDINAVTATMHHRIPNIQTTWHRLGSARVLSCIDLAKGFHQENLCTTDGYSAEDRARDIKAGKDVTGIHTGYTSAEKTAFSTDFGHFHFIGTPMGARNTPAYFQNRVETVLKKAA